MALARTCADEFEKLGHARQIYDLYRMGFDPILSAHELVPVGAGNPASADVLRAQDEITIADAVTVIYPLWWLSMPAMMKGFIDRVFARGFAYEAERGIVNGLLAGKKLLLVTVSGAPLPALIESGRWGAVETLQDTHIFRAAGFDLLEHVHFDRIAAGLPPAVAQEHLARMRARIRNHFGAHAVTRPE